MLKVASVIYLGFMTPLSAKTYYMAEERPFPCVSEISCETADEMDPTLVEVAVDYYDDLGTTYHWSRQLHRHENHSDCEKAMMDYFPYPFFKKCEATQ